MGRYLDRLRAKNSTDSYGEEVSKVSKAPFEPFETTLPLENRKNSGGGVSQVAGLNFSIHLQNGTLKSLISPRATLAEYDTILGESITGADLPPIPPYRWDDLEHEAVELQRAHRARTIQ